MRLRHRKLSAWYRQLAQQLDAGLPLADALRLSRGTGAPAASLEQMAATIERGGSVDDALRTAAWLPPGDVLALSAAAGAGRMPRTLDNLSARHAEIGAAHLRLALACVYPLGILHFGLLLLPVMGMIDWEKGFQWSTAAYVRGVLRTIVPLWSVGAVLWIMTRRGSPVLSGLARCLPGLRGYVRFQALADFCFGLAHLLEAGVPIGQAWAASGLITRSADLKAAAAAMETVIAAGGAPGRKLGAWPCFPAEFVGLYRSGEDTGHLEGNLHKLTAQYQDAANRALSFATLLYPALLFVAVAGTVAYHVISIYAAYLKMLDKIV